VSRAGRRGKRRRVSVRVYLFGLGAADTVEVRAMEVENDDMYMYSSPTLGWFRSHDVEFRGFQSNQAIGMTDATGKGGERGITREIGTLWR
jgi:hypothetical protein